MPPKSIGHPGLGGAVKENGSNLCQRWQPETSMGKMVTVLPWRAVSIFMPHKRKDGTSDLGHDNNQQSQATVVAWEAIFVCFLNKIWDQEGGIEGMRDELMSSFSRGGE